MKVTVSFDAVRLVVPCGDGQLQVGELVDRAVARYCKTVGKVFYAPLSYNNRLDRTATKFSTGPVRINSVTDTPVG